MQKSTQKGNECIYLLHPRILCCILVCFVRRSYKYRCVRQKRRGRGHNHQTKTVAEKIPDRWKKKKTHGGVAGWYLRLTNHQWPGHKKDEMVWFIYHNRGETERSPKSNQRTAIFCFKNTHCEWNPDRVKTACIGSRVGEAAYDFVSKTRFCFFIYGTAYIVGPYVHLLKRWNGPECNTLERKKN